MQTRSSNYSKQGSSSLQCFPGVRALEVTYACGHSTQERAQRCGAGAARRLCVRRPHGGSLKPAAPGLSTPWRLADTSARGSPDRPPRRAWPSPPASSRARSPVHVQSRCSPAQRRSFRRARGFTPRRCELPRGPRTRRLPSPAGRDSFLLRQNSVSSTVSLNNNLHFG